MKILAIETATEACSAALFNDGEIISRYEIAPRKHTQLILPMMDSVLAEAGVAKQSVDAVAFGRGPGAFTGLRIAVGIAQGLALALDKPVIPISSLAAMAQQVLDATAHLPVTAEASFVPAIDARMGEVYWANYNNVAGQVELVGEEKISAPEALVESTQGKHVNFGSGWEAYHPNLMAHEVLEINDVIHNVFPSAHCIAKLAATVFEQGGAIDAADAEPVYLRNDVAKKKADQGKPN